MSSVKALKGSIKVEGYSKSRTPMLDGSQLYSETHEVYGATIGELLDNLVEASVILASNAFMWAVMNKSASYVPTSDKWNVTVDFPEVIRSHGDADSSDNHLTYQGTLINFDSVVKYAVRMRNDQIAQAAFNLILTKVDEPSAIIGEPRSSLDSICNTPTQTFYELTKWGFTGDELDLILTVAEEEGRIKEYTAQNALIGDFPQREFLPRNKFQENAYI